IDQFADFLLARARESGLDEIILVGHSMGASLVLDVVARALARDPQVGRHGPDVCVLTVGSTIPKFTLHPAVERFRRCAARIAQEPSIAWVEYQVRSDAISFYKFDPLSLRHVAGDRFDQKPVIRRVQLHQMLERKSRLRHRHRVMRVHYQVVMANEQRATYDYLLMVCSPARTRRDRAREIALMAISASGLLVVPLIYAFSDQPRFANYPFHAWQAWLGGAIFVAALWLFRRTHKDLGRNWSVTLEVRERHTLVTSGVYSRVRHPMYCAFW